LRKLGLERHFAEDISVALGHGRVKDAPLLDDAEGEVRWLGPRRDDLIAGMAQPIEQIIVQHPRHHEVPIARKRFHLVSGQDGLHDCVSNGVGCTDRAAVQQVDR
jgi:hypothetical protein